MAKQFSSAILLMVAACAAMRGQSHGLCTTRQTPYFMTSWSGQNGIIDHAEKQTVPSGTYFACVVDAASADKPPECVLSFESGAKYNMPTRTALTPSDEGLVTLTCNGTSPICCKVQFAKPSMPPASNTQSGTKITPRRVRTFTSTTDANGNQHPAVADINPNGIIKCVSASGLNPNQYPPACFVLGQVLRLGQTAGTGSGGTMSLTCNGQGALRCTVSVTD